MLIRAILLTVFIPWGCSRYVTTWSPEIVPLGHRVVRSQAVVKTEVLVRPNISPRKKHLLELQVDQVKHCEGWHERAYRNDRVEHRLDPQEGSRGYTCLALPAGAALAAAGGVMLGAGLAQDDAANNEKEEGQRIAVGGGILLGLGVAMAALCPIDLFWPTTAAKGQRREGSVFTKKEKFFTFTCGQQSYAEGPLEVELPIASIASQPSVQASPSEEMQGKDNMQFPKQSDPSGLVELDLVRWLAATWSEALPDELYLTISGQRIRVPLAHSLRSRAATLLQQTKQTIAAGETRYLTVALGRPGQPLLYRASFQCRGDLRLVISSTPSSAVAERGSTTAGEPGELQVVDVNWRGERADEATSPSAGAGAMSVVCRQDFLSVLQVRVEPGALTSRRIMIKASPL